MTLRFYRTILLSIIIGTSLASCSKLHYRESTQMMLEKFPEARMEVIKHEGRNLRYLSLHRHDSLPTLFFLHGSPSTMSVYNSYYQDTLLAKWANIIAADRPGYGFSDMGRSEKSVRRQAEYMWKILEEEGYPSPLYIVGSSYGGTVAAKMAMIQPDKVNGLVLVSASLAPGEEKIYNISYILRYPPFRYLVPRMIMVANDEKLSHFESLNQMLPLWEQIKTPVILIQGTADKLIYPQNSSFAKSKLSNAAFVDHQLLDGEGHFLQIRYKDFILEKLQNLVNGNFGYQIEEQLQLTE